MSKSLHPSDEVVWLAMWQPDLCPLWLQLSRKADPKEDVAAWPLSSVTAAQ
jgi:hypothetical protein